MKRNLELLKQILTELGKKEDLYLSRINLPGVSEQEVDEHLLLLIDERLVEGEKKGYHVHVSRLTAAGHDFLAATRSPATWKRITGNIKSKGGTFTIEIVKTLASEYLKNTFGLK